MRFTPALLRLAASQVLRLVPARSGGERWQPVKITRHDRMALRLAHRSAAFVHHAESLAMCMLFGLPGFIQDAALVALANAAQSERSDARFLQ